MPGTFHEPRGSGTAVTQGRYQAPTATALGQGVLNWELRDALSAPPSAPSGTTVILLSPPRRLKAGIKGNPESAEVLARRGVAKASETILRGIARTFRAHGRAAERARGGKPRDREGWQGNVGWGMRRGK